MILHAASMIAVFVDQAKQAQCAVQCIPAVQEPWKWWFGALAPWIGPLLSGDRKSTRLNSSHLVSSYAVFFLTKTPPPRADREQHINSRLHTLAGQYAPDN